MTPLASRREFCALTLAGVAASILSGSVREPGALRIGILAPATGGSRLLQALKGLDLGAEEATRTALLFGSVVTFSRAAPGPSPADAADAARTLFADGADALCTALDAEASAAVAAEAGRAERLVVDVLNPPAPGGAGPGLPWVAHVAPAPEAVARTLLEALDGDLRPVRTRGPWMLLASSPAAASLAHAAAARVAPTAASRYFPGDIATGDGTAIAPGTRVFLLAATSAHDAATLLDAVPAAADVTVIDLFGWTRHLPDRGPRAGIVSADSWLPDLERFGAAQLNDRFRARYGAAARMDGAAWCGWFAAKALVESSLRARAGDSAGLRDTLFALRFDGHKGAPLAFSDDGVLVQPLHVHAPQEDRP